MIVFRKKYAGYCLMSLVADARKINVNLVLYLMRRFVVLIDNVKD